MILFAWQIRHVGLRHSTQTPVNPKWKKRTGVGGNITLPCIRRVKGLFLEKENVPVGRLGRLSDVHCTAGLVSRRRLIFVELVRNIDLLKRKKLVCHPYAIETRSGYELLRHGSGVSLRLESKRSGTVRAVTGAPPGQRTPAGAECCRSYVVSTEIHPVE